MLLGLALVPRELLWLLWSVLWCRLHVLLVLLITRFVSIFLLHSVVGRSAWCRGRAIERLRLLWLTWLSWL